MDNQELDEKLARWAGLGLEYVVEGSSGYEDVIRPKVPNFTESLDACFKWLVPNILNLTGVDFAGGDSNFDAWICKVWFGVWAGLGQYRQQVKQDFSEAEAETPALALCKAIEKLIEEENHG